MRLVEVLGPDEELRQGDVVKNMAGEGWPYGARHAFVLTADCDLAQKKHYGQVLLCPIITAELYSRLVWCQRKAEAIDKKIIDQVVRTFTELAARGVISEVSPSVLDIITNDVSVMAAALDGISGIAAGTRQELIRLAEARMHILRTDIDQLSKCRLALQAKDRKEVSIIHGSLVSDFKKDIAADAQDVVVIPNDIDRDGLVHVMLLRCPFSLLASSVCLTVRSGDEYLRLGRYVPEIKYLVAQKFGTLFSRVGMKRTIEDDTKISVALLEILE